MMDDKKLKAKMEVIMELLGMSEDAIGEDLKSHMDGMKEVTVAAPDEEGLAKGLDMAKEVVDSDEIVAEAASEMLEDKGEEMEDESDEMEDSEEDDELAIFGSKPAKKQKMKSKFNMLGED